MKGIARAGANGFWAIATLFLLVGITVGLTLAGLILWVLG